MVPGFLILKIKLRSCQCLDSNLQNFNSIIMYMKSPTMTIFLLLVATAQVGAGLRLRLAENLKHTFWFWFSNLFKQWFYFKYFEDTSLHETSVARSNKYGHMIWNFHLANLLSCSFIHGENVNSECLTMQVSGLCKHLFFKQ